MKEKQINQIAVLGLTYKQDTTLVEESAVMNIIKSLSQKGITVAAYDPAGIKEAKKELEDFENINFTPTLEECLKGKKLCLIGAPWQEFKDLDREKFIVLMDKQPVIFDGCGLYNFNSDSNLEYIRIGKNKS